MTEKKDKSWANLSKQEQARYLARAERNRTGYRASHAGKPREYYRKLSPGAAIADTGWTPKPSGDGKQFRKQQGGL